MSRKIGLLLLALLLQITSVLAQQSEIECSVYRRNGAYITLTPAHFDESLLPKVGETVHLLLLVKSDLPPGKNEGYYELSNMKVVKIALDIKSIIFKMDEDLESARIKTGLPKIMLNQESLVKISW